MTSFSGGKALQDKLKEMARKVDRSAEVRVGFLEDATYPDGTSVAMVASIQEFGAPSRRIPPRPFFRTMVRDKSPGWADALVQLIKANDYDSVKTLRGMGLGIEGQLHQSIIDTHSPPLRPITLMLRKMRADNPDLVVTGETVGIAAYRVAAGKSYAGVSTKPLVDTGDLLKAVSSEVNVK